MYHLITALPCCHYTGSLHLSEWCHHGAAGAEIWCSSSVVDVVSCSQCTGAPPPQKQMPPTPLVPPSLDLQSPMSSICDVAQLTPGATLVMKYCNLLTLPPPPSFPSPRNRKKSVVCICFSRWFSTLNASGYSERVRFKSEQKFLCQGKISVTSICYYLNDKTKKEILTKAAGFYNESALLFLCFIKDFVSGEIGFSLSPTLDVSLVLLC